jgi:hypothetical protein
VFCAHKGVQVAAVVRWRGCEVSSCSGMMVVPVPEAQALGRRWGMLGQATGGYGLERHGS